MSPVASMVGRAVLDWDQEITFPRPSFDETLPVGAALNDCKYLQTASHVDVLGQTNGLVDTIATAGGASVRYESHYLDPATTDGFPAIRLRGLGAGDEAHLGLEGIAAVLPITPTGTPTAVGASYPSASRVWWLKTLIRMRLDGGANPANGAGLLVMPKNAPLHSWPTNIVGGNNHGGFGVVQDGAGNWIYRSFDRTGVALVRESIVLPAHNIDDYNQAEWVMVARRPGFPAYVEFWFNSTLICTRNWGGVLLEPIGGVPLFDISEWHWVPSAHVLNQNGFSFLGVMRAGRFLRDGTEIQG